MGTEDVVGTLDQQTSEIRVAGLGDPKLRVSVPGLAASRSQAEVTTNIATLLEAFLAAQRQNERRCRDRANTMDLQQSLSLWILRLAKLLDLTIVLLDLERHLCDLFDHGTECLSESWRHHGQASLRKGARRRRRHAMSAGLRQPSYGVHRCRPQANDKVAGANQRKSFLLFDSPVRDRPQYLWIESGVAGQLLRVHLVALAVTMRDGSQLAHVRDEYFVTKLLQLLADPDRMRARFHSDTC